MIRNTKKLVSRKHFITAMRQVASSVTVVTTDGVAGLYGATVSAFSSVSADPPTVLICLFAESRIAKSVTENAVFCVNVLSEEDSEIADRFAGRHDDWVDDRFSGIDCYGKPGMAPQIKGATAFRCDVQQTVRSGSHLIVLGHVRAVLAGTASPLTYRDGGYHRVLPKGDQVLASANAGNSKNYKMLIDGEWVAASDSKTFFSMNPATEANWAEIPEATAEDVDRAVKAAHHACYQGEWARMSATQRGHYLRRLAELLAEHSERLGEVETRDTGKMFKETRWQAKYISEFYHFFAGAADKINGETLPIDKPDMFVFTNREPLGVIAAVVPWNSQLFLSAVKIGPALAAGNTVVLKASEHASAAMLEFGALIAEAGIPDGVVNIITGHGAPCGKTLTSHPLVARVSFTGGAESARHVIGNTRENFAEISLELGGKSPFIVFDDADIDSAVNGAVSGIFGASGQSCVAGSRLIIHADIADAFLERLAAIANGAKIGDPMAEETEIGPLCTYGQIENIEREIAQAVKEGGKIICGGKRADAGSALYFQPTIIDCPSPDLHIVDTELFGPVLSVLRFQTEEEALMLANDTTHGLAAGIFTRDNARAHRMSRLVRAGIIWVNTYRAVSPIAEFGGMKASGYGRESGFQAVYDYTRPKTIWVNTSSEPLGSQFVAR